METCPTCECRTMAPSKTTHSKTISGCVFTTTLPSEECFGCKEVVFRAVDLAAFERRIAQELLDHDGITGETLCRVRKILGMRGVDLAQLLGVTSQTVADWEAGKARPDRCTLAVLWMLTQDPAMQEYLARRTREIALPEKMTLEVKTP